MTFTEGSSEVTDIPMSFRPRGGRTVIVLPDGSRGVVRREATIDNTMIKVIARGFRWQRLLYDVTYATIEYLVAAEKSIRPMSAESSGLPTFHRSLCRRSWTASTPHG